MTELEQLRQSWKKTIHGDGGACPCCDRFGKVYSRGINKTMAQSLQWLYDQNIAKGIRGSSSRASAQHPRPDGESQ